jgi:hypothetical protein
MRPSPAYWRTPFGSWLRSYTVRRLTQRLDQLQCPVTATAVYSWVEGRAAPKVDHARAIVRLSQGGLTMAQIYARYRPRRTREGHPTTTGQPVSV